MLNYYKEGSKQLNVAFMFGEATAYNIFFGREEEDLVFSIVKVMVLGSLDASVGLF